MFKNGKKYLTSDAIPTVFAHKRKRTTTDQTRERRTAKRNKLEPDNTGLGQQVGHMTAERTEPEVTVVNQQDNTSKFFLPQLLFVATHSHSADFPCSISLFCLSVLVYTT